MLNKTRSFIENWIAVLMFGLMCIMMISFSISMLRTPELLRGKILLKQHEILYKILVVRDKVNITNHKLKKIEDRLNLLSDIEEQNVRQIPNIY